MYDGLGRKEVITERYCGQSCLELGFSKSPVLLKLKAFIAKLFGEVLHVLLGLTEKPKATYMIMYMDRKYDSVTALNVISSALL